MKETAFPRYMVYVGALQGAALWFLWMFTQDATLSPLQRYLVGALSWIFTWVPLAVYFTENTGVAWLRRAALLGVLAALCAEIGVYSVWMQPAAGQVDSWSYATGIFGGFSQSLGGLVMGFMLLSLVTGWRPERRRFDYAALFVVCWRNALLFFSVFIVVGLFWCVLLAGSMLMKAIGIKIFMKVIFSSVFIYPVTGAAAGAAYAIGHVRAGLLVSLRRFCLGLNAWLLPLLLAFGVAWVVLLPFTGLAPLFATHRAAYILLWFVALGVFFLNCAWQDGMDAPVYPRWLAVTLAAAWLSMVVVAGVAGWALWLRIRQYGFSEVRIWAAFVWLLASGYAVGYALSSVQRNGTRRWMHTVGRTNVVVAIVAVAGLFLLTTPLLDPRRMAVIAQVSRLEAGLVKPEDFKYGYLHWGTGPWGMRALQQLARDDGDARHRQIAGFASAELARLSWREVPAKPSVDVAAQTRPRLEPISAPGAVPGSVPDGLVNLIFRKMNFTQCGRADSRCQVWMHDINQDGVPDALVMITTPKLDAIYLFTLERKEWKMVSVLCCDITAEKMAEAIRHGRFSTVPRRWPDMMVNGARVQVRSLGYPYD